MRKPKKPSKTRQIKELTAALLDRDNTIQYISVQREEIDKYNSERIKTLDTEYGKETARAIVAEKQAKNFSNTIACMKEAAKAAAQAYSFMAGAVQS